MCGFAGFFGQGVSHYHSRNNDMLKRMADTIVYRGPDHEGYWYSHERTIGLAHRRLSIVDLSSAGDQPMHSASGRYVIAFNGEIYNHLELRKLLESEKTVSGWIGHSDTETLLAGFDSWGIQKTIERSIGMFAFSVWDNQTDTLTLGRDRIGEKPLYYGWQGSGNRAVFLFGSELKALRAHSAFNNEINRGAISLQLRYNTIPAPYSIYNGIAKLKPGCMLTVSLRAPVPYIWEYWSGINSSEAGISNPFMGSADQAINELDILLRDSVSKQMMADVPLGAFLSGGIDSSTVVALMQAQSSRPVKTFTIGFFEETYNEAKHANAVARHLGTDHTELFVTSEQAMAVIPDLPMLYDEPFSDASQIPTFLVSRLAKKDVTVSLSGDAGDELFCGYNRYILTARLWSKISSMPTIIRKIIANRLVSISPNAWNRFSTSIEKLLPQSLHVVNLGEKIHKGAGVLSCQSVEDLYSGLVSHWASPGLVVINGDESPTIIKGGVPSLNGFDDIQRMMVMDMLTYLPDDILVKMDRAAMSVSLETRVPFLDHRIVEFAWRLPQSMKLRDGQTKWILRQVLYKYVPKSLIERPKMGFGVPIATWLRGPLRDWAESLLDESRLRREGYFYPEPIRQKWKEHLSGRRNWQYHLWDVLMFQAWLEQQN